MKRYKYADHIKDNTENHFKLMKEKLAFYKNQNHQLTVEIEILREKNKVSEYERMIKERDEEIQSLKNDLILMRRASQNFVKQNEELEQRLILMNCTKELYSRYSSEGDEEKDPKDDKSKEEKSL